MTFAGEETEFAIKAARLALERPLQGHGYEVTSADVLDTFEHFVAAAAKRGSTESAVREAIALANAAIYYRCVTGPLIS